MGDSSHRLRRRSAAAGVALALLVWLAPADLALAMSAFERVCTMSCADSSSCCCKPTVDTDRRTGSPSPEMAPDDGASCRPDCAPATIVVRGDSQGRSPAAGRSPTDGTSTDLTSTIVHAILIGAPLDRFGSRAPPSSLAVV